MGWIYVQRRPHTTTPHRMSTWTTRGGLLLFILCLLGIILGPPRIQPGV
jgi:hypothetical protein